MNCTHLISALIMLFCFHSLRGEETDSVSVRSATVFLNPALRFFEHDRSVSAIRVSGGFERKGEAFLMQTGKETDGWEVSARTWMPLTEHTRLWGRAAYRYALRKSVSWNETSDLDLLYPYIMADSVGGDLRGQRYEFSGGYAGKGNRFTWGVQTDYRAEIEYRDRDPRPRNVISDFGIRAGGTFYAGNEGYVGISAGIRNYRQNNDVDFYSTLGNAFVHTMTGLGNSYTRFTGVHTSVDYAGRGYTAALQYFSKMEGGWQADVGYTVMTTVRHMKDDDNIPLTEMKDRRLQLSLSRIYRLPKGSRIGWGVCAMMTDRKGTENLFDSGNGNSYEKISSRSPYADKKGYCGTKLFFEPLFSDGMRLLFCPYFYLLHSEMSYAENNRRMEFTGNCAGMAMTGVLPVGGFRCSLMLNGAWKSVSGGRLELGGLSAGGMREMYEHDFRTLTADRLLTSVRLQTVFTGLPSVDIYGEVAWKTEFCRNMIGNNRRLEISAGICF